MNKLTPKSVTKHSDDLYALINLINDPKGAKKALDEMVKEAGVIENAKLKKMSVEQAEKMLADALDQQLKAQQILDGADEKAEKIISDANAEAEKIDNEVQTLLGAAKAKQNDLDALVAGKEADVLKREVAVGAREKRAEAREAGFAKREAELSAREAELNTRLEKYAAI